MAATWPEKLGALAYVLFFTAGFYCWGDCDDRGCVRLLLAC